MISVLLTLGFKLSFWNKVYTIQREWRRNFPFSHLHKKAFFQTRLWSRQSQLLSSSGSSARKQKTKCKYQATFCLCDLFPQLLLAGKPWEVRVTAMKISPARNTQPVTSLHLIDLKSAESINMCQLQSGDLQLWSLFKWCLPPDIAIKMSLKSCNMIIHGQIQRQRVPRSNTSAWIFIWHFLSSSLRNVPELQAVCETCSDGASFESERSGKWLSNMTAMLLF